MIREGAFEAIVGALMLYFIAKIIKQAVKLMGIGLIWPIAHTTVFIYAAFNHHRWYHDRK